MDFLIDRKLISFHNEKNLDGSHHVKKKKGSYYLPNHLYVVCEFDISLLPIKLNLPMVCKPNDWSSSDKKSIAKSISDLSGGYLCSPTVDIYDRYRLLSSGDHNHFYIAFGKNENSEELCSVMNKLQNQAFEINTDFLKYLLNLKV